MKLTLSLSELLLLVALAALSGYLAHSYVAAPGSPKAEIRSLAEAEPFLPPGSATLLSSPTSSPPPGPDPVQSADRPEAEAAARVGEPDLAPGLDGTGRLQIETDDSGAADAAPDGDSRGLDPNYEAYLKDLEAQEEAEDAAEDVFEEAEARPDPENVCDLDDEDEAADPEAYNEYLSGVAERAEQRRLEREEQRAE